MHRQRTRQRQRRDSYPRDQAPAWSRTCLGSSASLGRHQKRARTIFSTDEAELRRQGRSQAGAWEREREGNALGNLGVVHAALGDLRKAIEYYEQALVIDREIGDRRGEGNALFNSARVLDSLGNRPEAIARAAAALAIFEAIESPNAAQVRAALARWRGGAGKAEGGGRRAAT